MKNIIAFMIIILSMNLFVSSADASDNNNNNNNSNKDSYQIKDLVLNNGKRWIANSETTDGINNMIKIADSIEDIDNMKSYEIISKKLDNNFSLIFKRCTMEGESHNQLHNYLVPLKSIFEGIKAEDLDIKKSNLKILKLHLKEYSKFFK